MSCGTRVQDFRPGDPDGAGLLRSSLLINYSPAGTAYHWSCELFTAAPDHCGPPGAVVSPVTVLQPLWLRNSTTAPSCELQLLVLLVLLPGSSSLPGLVDLDYKRNHNHTTDQCLLWLA